MRARSSWWSMVAGASLVVGLVQAGSPASAMPASALAPASATTVGPAGASTAGMLQSGTATIQSYVTKVYNDLFHRSPDPSGLATWTGKLEAGTPYGEVANAITSSDEYRSGLIASSYTTYLGRGAEAAGLAFWLGRMRAGEHIEDMQAGFIASDEFYARGGGTARGWVTRLYQTVLSRIPAASEVDWWVSAIAGGMNRGTVAGGFLYSTEHLTTVVDGYYVDLLDRHIDPSGKTTWVGLIQHGHRDEEIIAGIVSSDEYRGKAPLPEVPPTVRLGLVSIDTRWEPGTAISDDGRWVAFDSDMRVIVDGQTGASTDVYLWDRVTGTTTLVSTEFDGVTTGGRSFDPSISADGRWVAFNSMEWNLVDGTSGPMNLFVWDRLTGTTARIEGGGTAPSISAGGRWVAYELRTTDPTRIAVYVADRTTGATTLMSTTAQAESYSREPAISADGRWITFTSRASDLVGGDTDGTDDVFLWDRTTGQTSLVSVDGAGMASGGYGPAISADGSWIANNGDCRIEGEDGVCDVLAWNRSTGVSSTVRGGLGSIATVDQTVSISADGRWITYQSVASDLVESDENDDVDVFRTDRVTGVTSLVSAGPGRAAADGFSLFPVISGDGRWIAYYSFASNLVAGGSPGGQTDLFVTGPMTD